MPLNDLIAPEAVLHGLRAQGKKQALQKIAERAAGISGIDAREIFDALHQRERLGSTGVGAGVAIPHTKLAHCRRLFAVFASLAKPIDFESPDGQPVDLICALIAPEGAGADHLKALARVARLMRDPRFVAGLRAAPDAETIHSALTRTPESHAA